MGVGKNIKAKREDLNLTQDELANKVGITQAMLSQIERGTKNPSLPLGFLLAEALNCDVSELVE